MSSVSTIAPRSAGITSRISSNSGRSSQIRPRIALMAPTTFNSPCTSRAMRAGDSSSEASLSGPTSSASSRVSWTTFPGAISGSNVIRSEMDIPAFKKPPSPLNYHWEMTARNSTVNRYKNDAAVILLISWKNSRSTLLSAAVSDQIPIPLAGDSRQLLTKCGRSNSSLFAMDYS